MGSCYKKDSVALLSPCGMGQHTCRAKTCSLERIVGGGAGGRKCLNNSNWGELKSWFSITAMMGGSVSVEVGPRGPLVLRGASEQGPGKYKLSRKIFFIDFFHESV